MTDKFKKIERQYVLSDSSVNEYGFRLLTSGYQLEAFQKNPIGYYMHRREDGIVLKWDDLCVEDDKILGMPVINLSNGRGEQTCDEAENGFLNAASVGHIVVLEYSMDPAAMLPGQTGPTITKWYNKECSLVDIPGNCNALTKLYDEQENEICLADLGASFGEKLTMTSEMTEGSERERGAEGRGRGQRAVRAICRALKLENVTDEKALTEAVQNLAVRTDELELENKTLVQDKVVLQQQLEEIRILQLRSEVTGLLDRALEDKKLTVELRNKLATDYAKNPEGLKGLLSCMPAYGSIAAQLKNKQSFDMLSVTEASFDKLRMTEWEWDDYEKNDSAGMKLKELRANDPERYKELFDKKFNVQS